MSLTRRMKRKKQKAEKPKNWKGMEIPQDSGADPDAHIPLPESDDSLAVADHEAFVARMKEEAPWMLTKPIGGRKR